MMIGRTMKPPRAAVQSFAFLLFLLLVASRGLADKQPPVKPLDLNSATVEQLEQLPGVGPRTAQEIVKFREKSGPFRRVEDLLAIRGITKRRLEKLRPYVIVTPPAAPPKQKSENGREKHDMRGRSSCPYSTWCVAFFEVRERGT
jgi:competence ComEA-like helix-hairpin-helix protein